MSRGEGGKKERGSQNSLIFSYITRGDMNLSPQIHEMPHLKGNTVHCDPDVLYPSNSTTSALDVTEHNKFTIIGQTLNKVRSTS